MRIRAFHKSLTSWALLFCLLLFPRPTSAEKEYSFPELLHAQADFVRAVGEARLAWAQAYLYEAQARYWYDLAEMLETYIKRLRLELRRLAKDEYKMRAEIERVVDHSKRLKMLNSGKTSPGLFSSLQVLMRYIPQGVVIEAMTSPVAAAPATDFLPNLTSKPALAFAGGNLGQLVYHMQKNYLSFQPWCETHVVMLRALEKMSIAVEEQVLALRETLFRIKERTLEPWVLPGEGPWPLPGGNNPGFSGSFPGVQPPPSTPIPPKPTPSPMPTPGPFEPEWPLEPVL